MGTRSLTFVYDSYKDEDGKMVHRPIINLYRQYDGYPSGHGAEIAEFLAPLRVGNGISGDATNFANGMGCLAAQLVAHFKDGAGQFYLYPTDCVDCGQDYEYHIYLNEDNQLCVRITDRGCNLFGLTMSDTNESLFDGPVVSFETFCKEAE
jgi:hypothetical protein